MCITTNWAMFRMVFTTSILRLSAWSLFLGCSSACRKLLIYDYESLADFVQQRVKVQCQNNLLRVDNDVYIRGRPRFRKADRFAQPALHAVTLNRTPEHPAHGESDTQA